MCAFCDQTLAWTLRKGFLSHSAVYRAVLSNTSVSNTYYIARPPAIQHRETGQEAAHKKL